MQDAILYRVAAPIPSAFFIKAEPGGCFKNLSKRAQYALLQCERDAASAGSPARCITIAPCQYRDSTFQLTCFAEFVNTRVQLCLRVLRTVGQGGKAATQSKAHRAGKTFQVHRK